HIFAQLTLMLDFSGRFRSEINCSAILLIQGGHPSMFTHRSHNTGYGFTLIELLIVVAIIAILAAIAVPNFLEAQTRAKVSRNMADFRTATTAFEMYHVDYGMYPYDGYFYKDGSNGYPEPTEYNHNRISKNLTTPVAYLNTCIFPDPFNKNAPPPRYW